MSNDLMNKTNKTRNEEIITHETSLRITQKAHAFATIFESIIVK